MNQQQLQLIYGQMFNEAIQEPEETPLDFYLRLEMYSIIAYPQNQYGEMYRFNRRIMQFVIGANLENQTIEETDELMTYIMYQYGYI